MAADIERSNSGIYIAARPSWVGKLHVMKEQKQTTTGLTLLVEVTKELAGLMGGTEPKILVGGRKRFCRVWREKTDTTICDRCLQVGHTLPERLNWRQDADGVEETTCRVNTNARLSIARRRKEQHVSIAGSTATYARKENTSPGLGSVKG